MGILLFTNVPLEDCDSAEREAVTMRESQVSYYTKFQERKKYERWRERERRGRNESKPSLHLMLNIHDFLSVQHLLQTLFKFKTLSSNRKRLEPGYRVF